MDDLVVDGDGADRLTSLKLSRSGGFLNWKIKPTIYSVVFQKINQIVDIRQIIDGKYFEIWIGNGLAKKTSANSSESIY